MRDLLVLAFTCGGAFFGLTRPWIGVLALAVLAYMNPHRYAWRFAQDMSVYLIVFLATAVGMILTKDKQPFSDLKHRYFFCCSLFTH